MVRFVKEYLVWHYGESLAEFLDTEKNFLWFGYHFFSLPLLARTFAAPIYRLEEKKARAFDIGAILGNFIVTTLMRLVGMLVRTVIIAAGLLFESMLLMVSAPAFLIWLLLPIITPLLCIFGIATLLM